MGTLLVSVEMIKSARYLTSLGGARPICDKWSTPYQTLDTKLPLQGHSQEFVFTEAKKEDARKKCADIKCFAISYTSVHLLSKGHSISNQRKIKRDPSRFLSNLVRSEYLWSIV